MKVTTVWWYVVLFTMCGYEANTPPTVISFVQKDPVVKVLSDLKVVNSFVIVRM